MAVPMPSRHPRELSLAGLLVLAGCAGVPRVVTDLPTMAYSPLEFTSASAGRDFNVVVLGNPFGGDDRAFAATVVDAMQGRHAGPRTHFTTTPDESARRDYRAVLVFNPAVNILNAGLCGSGPVPVRPPAPGQPIMAQAAFCRSGGEMSGVTGWLEEVRSADEPGFRALVGSMTYELFPAHNPESGCGIALC
jgi:hypothetical protein